VLHEVSLGADASLVGSDRRGELGDLDLLRAGRRALIHDSSLRRSPTRANTLALGRELSSM